MDFLKPKPIRRQKCQKSKQNSFITDYKKSIFEEIRSLCRTPAPIVSPIDDLNLIFNEIRCLCRLPSLLTPIEDLNEIKWSEVESEPKQKRKRGITSKQYYRDSDVSEESLSNKSNSFDSLHQSKLFCTLVKGKQTDNKTLNNKNIKICNQNNKRSTVKCCAKSGKPVIRAKPLLSINCDINKKINEYSKEFSKLKKRLRTEKTDSDSSEKSSVSIIGETDPFSISSPSISNSIMYSLPATPISSSDSSTNSSSSTVESTSTQSLLNRLRKALNSNIKIESYRQYFEQEVNSKPKKGKRPAKQTIDFKQKVLEWKANRISSGYSTPVHNIEYLETPPGSPLQLKNNTIDDEFNELMTSLENENYCDFNLTDNMVNEFNTFLSDLCTDSVVEQTDHYSMVENLT